MNTHKPIPMHNTETGEVKCERCREHLVPDVASEREARLVQAVERAKREVTSDIEAGTVPSTVATFSELHDYVDANGYGGAFEDDAWPCEDSEFWNEVQDAVNDWLAIRPH